MSSWNYYQILETGDFLWLSKHYATSTTDRFVTERSKYGLRMSVVWKQKWLCKLTDKDDTERTLSVYKTGFLGLMSVYDIKVNNV